MDLAAGGSPDPAEENRESTQNDVPGKYGRYISRVTEAFVGRSVTQPGIAQGDGLL